MARLAFGCLKGSLFFFNLAFFALGGVLLGLSAYSMKMGRVGEVVSVPQVALGALLLACVVVVLSFLGCCGALRESRGMIGTYFVLLLLVIAGQVIVGFVTVKYTSDVQDMVAQGWNKSDTETRKWVEQEFNCCGLFVLEHNCNLNSTATPSTCYDKLSDFVETRLRIVQIAAITIGCVQILGLIVSCCLFASIPTKKEEHNRLLDEARRVNKYAELHYINDLGSVQRIVGAGATSRSEIARSLVVDKAVSSLVRPERSEEGEFIYNVINMDQVKQTDIIEEIYKNGLFVHVMANFRENMFGRSHWRIKHSHIHVSIPLDVASRLVDLLSTRKDYLKINLKDTKLFKSSEIWKMLDWSEFKKPKMSLVLVRDPMRYENVVESRERKKLRLITAGLVLTNFFILPAIAMAVKGFKMSTTGKAYGKWNKLFDTVYDVTTKSVITV